MNKHTEYVKCPICGEGDMPCEVDEEGHRLIKCLNTCCGSNGGSNFDGLTPKEWSETEERWAIWYDGTEGHGHTPGLVRGVDILLFNSKNAAGFHCERPAYTPVRVKVCVSVCSDNVIPLFSDEKGA